MTEPMVDSTAAAQPNAETEQAPAAVADTVVAPGSDSVPTHADPADNEQDTAGMDEDQDDGRDPDTSTRVGRDAAKYRRRLREAEAERDHAAAQLAASHRAMIDWRAQNPSRPGIAKVDPALLDAAGMDISTLVDTETGLVDMQAVDDFLETVADRFNVAKGLAPNRSQGIVGGHAGTGGLAGFFKSHQ
ncbi:hypothetical protein [Mycolicibacterium smegmatis]|uniref:hypothetical protein n=1 Tax=Mycolicibacterium smegmatis TaxID=1772 RepID=UPI001EFC17F3|nr:hypothetical protein [Mycolicibacterium smegmatis]ULN34186.1 hypothetical protein KZ781_25940 [Mycolicibacterium smegmatis]